MMDHRKLTPPWARIGLAATAAVAIVGLSTASPDYPAAAAMPAWFAEHLAASTRDGGRFEADNRSYRSDAEPVDRYAIEWTYGIGHKSMKGRLFGLRGDVETATLWEIRTFWHPGRREAVVQQYAADGTVASGTLSRLDDGEFQVELDIFDPAGSTQRARDALRDVDADTHETASSMWVDDEWVARRSYTWTRVSSE